ncbi:hypothetical protein SGFS_011120 [Streptomyces graminofaciens]|jgi:hypothetical protein|uniref:Uncharacterized protein n=1 Tax=Streptomyces graminofaciens TaxID=68212 RepID=A0ABM7F222_9ACTN|nr:hypothetical protein SGFS_011120 [Streptomyces graminofaciens]
MAVRYPRRRSVAITPLAAVDVGDRPVAELDEVVDDLPDPVVVGGPYDVQVGVGDPPADGDDR